VKIIVKYGPLQILLWKTIEFFKNTFRNHYLIENSSIETTILDGCCEIVHSKMEFKDDLSIPFRDEA